MGVKFKKDRKFVIRPYIATQTFKNLEKRRQCVVNLTYEPEVFFRSAFKKSGRKDMLPVTWFERSGRVEAPRLRGADASIEAGVTRIRRMNDERAEVSCNILDAKVLKLAVKGYCRANFAVIESVIHATRLRKALSEGRKSDVRRFIALIREYQKLTERVAPKTKYVKIMDELLAMFNSNSKGKKS